MTYRKGFFHDLFRRMGFKPSILNVTSAILVAGCGLYGFFNLDILFKAEGAGMFIFFGLISAALVLLLLDYGIQKLIKNKMAVNAIEGFITLAMVVLIIVIATQ